MTTHTTEMPMLAAEKSYSGGNALLRRRSFARVSRSSRSGSVVNLVPS